MRKSILFAAALLFGMTFSYAQITSVGLIGSATPNGWDSDVDMVQDTADMHLWSLNIDLVAGEAKFRADDDWAVNWGDTGFPWGTGVQDGPNIPVGYSGNYTVTFNDSTGAYYFEITSPIGIIGDATPGGWAFDTNMFPDTADTNVFVLTLDLGAGEAKFRQDDDWPVNWGAADFPTGIGVQDGPNIPIAKAGNYTVTLDTASGAYSFTENVTYTTIGIIGDGTPGGWDADSATAMTQSDSDPNVWILSTTLPGGGLQFTGNNGEVVWGADGFPTDTAIVDGDTLQVPAGDWQIEFNTETGIYDFTLIEIFASVGIIGDATPGGWDVDTDMERDPADSSKWSIRMDLLDGEAKFRADDDWAVNWGAGDFPEGVGIRDGANIPITAGEYIITFNSLSGEYFFKELIIYDSLGMIGTGTEFANWDDDVWMTKDASDENVWLLESAVLSQDGEVKFRAEGDWTVNWGLEDFPSGVGVQDGPNIIITAGGTYGIVLNSATGEYAFGDPFTIGTSREGILDPATIKAYPNPTRDLLNLDLSNAPLRGKVFLKVFDMRGQLIQSFEKQAGQLIQLNVSNLVPGAYSLQFTDGKYIVGKRFVLTQ